MSDSDMDFEPSSSHQRKEAHKKSKEDSESDPDQGNGQWEIERIRGHKVTRGQVRYHVQWKLKPGQKEDWSDSENWVLEKQMNAPELVRSYWRRHGGRKTAEEASPIKKSKRKPKNTRHDDLDEIIISDEDSDDDDSDKEDEDDDDEIQIIRPSPKKKSRLNDDDDFIVSDDEIDPPRKSSRTRKRERSRSRSRTNLRQRSKEKKEPRPIVMPHIPTKSSSSESISSGDSLQSFVASDTEEGLLIPTRKKRADRTPSPVVVSHKKKPTWQEKIHLNKDKYLFDTDDEAPTIVTDDEERQEAIRIEAKRDEEAKQKERRKLKEAKRPSIAKKRKGYISTSSSEGEADEDLHRRRRRFSSSSESICMKKVTRPKPDRYTVDYRADDIQLSKSSLDSLMKQVALREKKPGSYKAKGSLSMCETKTGKQSHSNIKTNVYDKDADELEEMTDAMRSNKLRDEQKFTVHSPATRSIQDDIYESHKELTPLRAPLDVRRGDERNSSSDFEEEPTPLYRRGNKNKNKFGQTGILGESSSIVRLAAGKDSSGDDDNNISVGGEQVDEESADQGEPHQDFVMQPEHLPPEDPLFDTYERFALECWENKYKAIENSLKPVFILQFFANPPDEPPMDWSMVVFENKPGQLPRHVCECVPTGVMLDIHPQLVIDCEDRLRSNGGRSLQLISEKWLRDYEKEKKRKSREQKRLLSDS